MFNAARRLTGASVLGLLLALPACDTLEAGFDGGYDKVAFREQTGLPAAPAPNPPRYVAGFGSAGGATAPTLDPANTPTGVTQEMVTAGQQAYGTICVACHGAGGAGTAAAPQLSDAQWLNISGNYEEIVQVITNGVPAPREFPAPMPPMGGGSFTPDQVRELAAYVFALSHAAP